MKKYYSLIIHHYSLIILIILAIAGGAWFGQDYLKNFPLFSSLFGGFQQESVVPASSLVGYWSMERNGNTLYDRSKHSNNGTITGATSVPGKKGTGLEFDISEENYVSMGDIFNMEEESFSISAWIYPTEYDSGYSPIVSKKQNVVSGPGYALQLTGSTLYFRVKDSDDDEINISASGIALNDWYYITATFDGSTKTGTLFVDGNQENQNTNASIGDISAGGVYPFVIGSRSIRSDYFFGGTIDEVRIYDRVLTTEEITALYREGTETIGGGEKGLIAHYSLDQEDETVSTTDILSGWDFTSGWSAVNCTFDSATQFTDDGTGTARPSQSEGSLISGNSYKVHIAGTVSAGTVQIRDANATTFGEAQSGTFDYTTVIVADSTRFGFKLNTADANVNFTTIEIFPVATADVTPNANHGAITVGSGGYTTNRKGQSNSAYNFDGTLTTGDTKIVTNITSNNDFLNGFTISAWIKPESVGEGGTSYYGRIVSKDAGTTGNNGFSYHMQDNDSLRFLVNSGDIVNSGNNITLGVWQHVLVTVDSDGNVQHYVNGVVEHSGTTSALSGNITTSNALTIGNRIDASRTFDGDIDDVKIYNRVLTPTEIQTLYDAYNPEVSINGLAKGLVGHWELTKKWSNSTTVQDLTPYNNNGTATNGPVIGGRATYFDGSDSHVVVGQPSELDFTPNTDEFTLSAWINTANGNEGTVLSKAEATAGNRQYQIYVDNNTTLKGNVGGTTLSSGVVVADSTWHHIVGVNYDDSGTKKFKFYVDGVADDSIITSGSATNNKDVIIGARRDADNTDLGYPYEGKISDVRIYNYALSSTDITQLYNMGRPRATDRVADLDGSTPQYFTLDDGADAGDDLEPTTNSYILEAWVNADAFSANQILVAKSSDITGSTNLYGMYLNTSGKLVGKIADSDSVTTSTDDGTALTADRWYHTAIAFDRSGNMTRYIDGTATGTADDISSEADSITNAVAFSVGAESDGGLPLDGQIDSVRVYEFTSGLPANIASIMTYNAQSKGRIHPDIASSLVEGYDFNSDSWATVTSTHNLTNNGSATYVKP